ncbi:MAG: hypothetical protein M1343_10470 [Chloroflexi bacterium]|nr:hypothetical protein [Chloroflexota bacterium]MDA8217769.1 hypothetical protein [Dehalococcoidales bacterium]
MSSRSRWLISVAIVLLAVACSGAQSPLQEAVASLETARSYQVEYELITFFEGTAKPVVAAGKIEFEAPARWHISQDSIEMIAVGPTIYIEDAEGWRAEEMMELPVHPLLYLKAATDARRSRDSEGSRIFAFTVDRAKYRQSFERVLGVVPPELDRVIARFRGSGEVTLDGRGRTENLRLHLQDASIPGKTRQELEIRLLDSAEDPSARAYAGAGRLQRGGEGL